MTCTSTAPSVSTLVNFSLFLNVPFTSRITNTSTLDTETLLLIDEPQPGIPNTSNTFPYFGQVPGTLGVAAGAPGSGNVYQGKSFAVNEVVWAGVPYVTGGTRTFRFTNIRADAAVLGGSGAIQSFISVTGSVSIAISSPVATVAQSNPGLNFSSSIPASPTDAIDLHFKENFTQAFLKRIENTLGGPLTAIHQDVPGFFYCTESGFTPEFSAVTPGAVGSATTGTRLLARLSNIPPSVFVVIVPNEVTSSSGNLVAHRVFPPLGPTFAGGTVSTFGGFSFEFVNAAHKADLLYEVTAAAPFQGRNGCLALDAFDIRAFGFFPVSLAPVNVTGQLAPVDPTATSSATAPEPRFLP
ncbi:MAG TPA: hypothetical protein VEU96_33055 [Bryobacteraceae bacterium]|nr:hypothetical protein [Bryobacteraceae bacterium]